VCNDWMVLKRLTFGLHILFDTADMRKSRKVFGEW
jgi:hypothetical protein